MKKSLLILSALGFAGAASAQSSIVLFGIVDATLAYGRVPLPIAHSSRAVATTRPVWAFAEQRIWAACSAGFWLEAGVNTDDGTGGATNTNNQANGGAIAGIGGGQGLTFARRATVQLAGPWGEFRLGRDYTPQYSGFLAGDPFGNVGVGASVNYTSAITGVTTARASNALHYLSPTFAGFNVQLVHYRGENASNSANADDGTGNGIRVAYAGGPFSAGVGYGRTEYAAGDVVQRNIDAQWDFKVAKVIGDINRDRAGAITAKGASLGVLVPVAWRTEGRLFVPQDRRRRQSGSQEGGDRLRP